MNKSRWLILALMTVVSHLPLLALYTAEELEKMTVTFAGGLSEKGSEAIGSTISDLGLRKHNIKGLKYLGWIQGNNNLSVNEFVAVPVPGGMNDSEKYVYGIIT